MAASTAPQAGQVGSASWVSEHFVRLFYSVLARHPGHLSKFYKEHSSLCVSLSSAAGSPPAFAHGDLQAVQNIVNTTIAFAQCTPDFTDSVFSIDGGVVIQCVGRIAGLQGQSRERPYVQTFFLARQEHGYYVLNDLLRLLPEQQPYASSPVASTLPPSLAHPATQEEIPPYVPNQKLLQDLQAANQPRPPTMNGPPTAPQAPPAAPAPSPASKPSPAPGPQQQPQSAPSTQPKATQPAAPAPAPAAPPTTATPAQPSTTQPQPVPQPPSRPVQPTPQFKVPEIPQPPPNLTLADRLKFIEEHKEKQQKAIQAFHKQQQAAAAQAAQPQAAAGAGAGAAAAAPQEVAQKGAAPAQQQQRAAAPAAAAAAAPQPPKAAAAQKGAAPAQAPPKQAQQQQPQQQQAQQQGALPQREEQRPSRAAAQQQRAARQQQQQQQQQGGAQQQQQQQADAGGGAHTRPTANGHAGAPSQDKADVQGVYVRGLPQGEELTEALLEEHFSKFGPLKALPGVPAVVIHVSPKYGKTAYIKFEQASSVQAARQSPPTIGSNTCEVLPMLTQYMNGPQPGMKGVGASRGGFRGAPRRGGRGGGGGGRGSGSGPEDRERSADQGSSAPHRDFGTERPPRPAGAPDRRPPSMGGRGGSGRGNRSRSGSASRPKRDQQGAGPQGQPGPTPTYVPVATSQ